jgi:hypothetical protein
MQVQKLRNAMREYENDRWRIISTKVGSGFSPVACKEKAVEIGVGGQHPQPYPASLVEHGEHEQRERGGEGLSESSLDPTARPESSSTDAAPTYQ